MTQTYHILGLIVLLLIAGCSQPIVINPDWACQNTTYIYLNHTEIINNTVPCAMKVQVNQTVCDPRIREPCQTGGYSRIYVNSLLRDIKILQWNQNKFWNYSDCQVDLNKTKADYLKAKNELCDYYNSSWC